MKSMAQSERLHGKAFLSGVFREFKGHSTTLLRLHKAS